MGKRVAGKRDSGCSLVYRKDKGLFAFRFPVEGYGMQEFLFSEEEYMGAGLKAIIERARFLGGALGAGAAKALEGTLMPLGALRRAEALPKLRRGTRADGSKARAHPRVVRLMRKLEVGERKQRKPNASGKGRRMPTEEERKRGLRLMEEAVRRGAEQCSYAPYGRYLFGWHEATGRGDEPKRLLREFCQKVDARQKNKV